MIRLLLLVFAWTGLVQQTAWSQHQADHWYFGVKAGIRFQSGTPTALDDGVLITNEGCSSVSDPSGNLLFYTDGITVWNKNHIAMPNGTGLLGGISSTQSALIVPLPGSSQKFFYVFTVDEIGGPNGFRYSIVDITLDGGLGDVTSKNVLVQNTVTEKIAAGIHSNGVDYWIIVHLWGNDVFHSYRLSPGGLDAVPVISSSGMVHSTAAIQNTYGQMKLNTCEDMLAVAAGYLDTVEVFRFDPSSGKVSDPITLPMDDHVYGIEFSPEGFLLYVTCYSPAGTLLQYDLTSGDQAVISASKIILSTMEGLYGLQRGPDYKIYVCPSFSSYLGVIHQPDVPGLACDYQDSGFNVDPNGMGITTALSLPGFVQSFFAGKTSCLPTAAPAQHAAADFSVFPNPSSSSFQLITGEMMFPATCTVYNLSGQRMETFSLAGPASAFHFGKELAPGIFRMEITYLQERVNTLLVKQR